MFILVLVIDNNRTSTRIGKIMGKWMHLDCLDSKGSSSKEKRFSRHVSKSTIRLESPSFYENEDTDVKMERMKAEGTYPIVKQSTEKDSLHQPPPRKKEESVEIQCEDLRETMSDLVVLENIRKEFNRKCHFYGEKKPSKIAVRDLSFSIPPGQCFGSVR